MSGPQSMVRKFWSPFFPILERYLSPATCCGSNESGCTLYICLATSSYIRKGCRWLRNDHRNALGQRELARLFGVPHRGADLAHWVIFAANVHLCRYFSTVH